MAVTPPPVVQVQPMQIQHHLDLSSVQCAVSDFFSTAGHVLWGVLVGVVLGALLTIWYKRAGSIKAMVQTVEKDVSNVKSEVTSTPVV